jgi:hypothetical protein
LPEERADEIAEPVKQIIKKGLEAKKKSIP